MKTASAKAKGRRLQQYVRDCILSLFPELTKDDVTSRSMGAQGTDILLSREAKDYFPFAIEYKNQEKLNIWDALEQTEENSNDCMPMLIFTRNGADIYCCIKWDDFMRITGEDEKATTD